MMKRKLWLQAVAGCLAVALSSLGLIAGGFADDKGRDRGQPAGGGRQSDPVKRDALADAGRGGGGGGGGRSGGGGGGGRPSGGGGTIHAPSRGGGNSQPAAPRGQTPNVNRTPAFSAPKTGGSGVGAPGVGRPGIGTPGVGAPGPGAAGVGRPGVGAPGPVGASRTNVGVGNTNTVNNVGNTRVGVANQSLGGNSVNVGNQNVNLAAAGYHPAYYGHSAYHGYWNGNYGYGHGYPGYGYGYGYGYRYYRPLGWGLGAWGLGALAYNSGYLGYSNPYYNGSGYNYGQPVPVSTSSPTPGSADAALNAAITAFQQTDYDKALDLVNQGITQSPTDAVLHEFRALVLFAKADYQQAAATIHSVLAVGPGWNWTTLSRMYNDTALYTTQLRALETTVRGQPQDGAGRFLLAYHYMTGGYNEAAARQLKQVVTLQPTDRVAADLLRMISPPTPDQSVQPAPPPAGGTAAGGKTVDAAALVGLWSASRDDGSTFSLSLTNDERFVWKFSQKDQKSQELSGKYTLAGDVLALEGTDGGSLIANVTPGVGKKFNFKLLGAPSEDPGLDFGR